MKKLIAAIALVCLLCSCGKTLRHDIIFDTDANNELDDQHAIAYVLMNPDAFRVLAITTNNTHAGGGIAGQSEEARRVVALAGKYGKGIEVLDGAEANFNDISDSVENPEFDGCKAVNFIIGKAKKYSAKSKLTIIAVGKLTNVALALKKAPEISPKIRVVWLGGNYPEPGEYNLVNDIPSMNYVLDTDAQFEMVTVRYNKPSGTNAVRVTRDFVEENFAGKGPRIAEPVTGRHGGSFTCFGDYSVNLFQHIKLGPDNGRALFDLCAAAIVKNPSWGSRYEIPAPTMPVREWSERPSNPRKISVWENFDRDAIVGDFLAALEKSR